MSSAAVDDIAARLAVAETAIASLQVTLGALSRAATERLAEQEKRIGELDTRHGELGHEAPRKPSAGMQPSDGGGP